MKFKVGDVIRNKNSYFGEACKKIIEINNGCYQGTLLYIISPDDCCSDIFCIILGGIIGPNLNIKITYKYREPLIKIFGISALAIGIISFIKVNCLPCVILALILGFILGKFFDLDTKKSVGRYLYVFKSLTSTTSSPELLLIYFFLHYKL